MDQYNDNQISLSDLFTPFVCDFKACGNGFEVALRALESLARTNKKAARLLKEWDKTFTHFTEKTEVNFQTIRSKHFEDYFEFVGLLFGQVIKSSLMTNQVKALAASYSLAQTLMRESFKTNGASLEQLQLLIADEKLNQDELLSQPKKTYEPTFSERLQMIEELKAKNINPTSDKET